MDPVVCLRGLSHRDAARRRGESKRPGRSSAGSRTSGRLVAATRITPFIRLEAVHLDQQLIEGLLAFVMTAAQAGAAMASDGVYLIDENDTRRMLLALHEKIAHARSADAYKHLDKVGTRNRKERNARFTPRSRVQAASFRCPERRPAGRLSGCGRRGA